MIGAEIGVHKMAKTTEQENKALVLEAFDTLYLAHATGYSV
jgi:hypothetical protein